MNNYVINHLIVDSGGFIKNAPLKDIGVDIYTVAEVVNEIRDKNTRQRLQVLPYELKFLNPLISSLNAVTEFSKKTGDYLSLSATDLKLIALTHQLTLLHDKSIEIKTEPKHQINWNSNGLNDMTNIPGFYMSAKSNKSLKEGYTNDCHPEIDCTSNGEKLSTTDARAKTNICDSIDILLNITDCDESDLCDAVDITIDDLKIIAEEFNNSSPSQIISNEVQSIVNGDEGSDDDDDEACNDDEDDEAGWITPDNVNQALVASSKECKDVTARPTVACLTTDFAMQNVLIQMGLKVVSIDGFIIKRANSYVLRCYSCFKISKDTSRQFCHHCGNMSLQKVAMSIDESGEISYQNKKLPSARGTRYSLPMPKGGKHSWNPVLCEDQFVPQQRLRKKDNEHDMDHINLECPFSTTDVKSRAKKHGFHVRSGYRKNPNDNSQSRRHKK